MTWRTPLVGRTAEIKRLEDELRRAAGGEFRSLMILGEPGLGKTRLIGEFLSAHAGDAIALSARGHPLAITDSFGLWAEALDRHLRRLSDDEVRAICGGLLDDLGALLRTVAAAGGRDVNRVVSAFSRGLRPSSATSRATGRS
jgi:predicted ATPase